MPPKKKADTAEEEPAAEFEPSDFGVGPDDPSYQRPAFASPKQVADLEHPIDARMKALLKDHQAMGAR